MKTKCTSYLTAADTLNISELLAIADNETVGINDNEAGFRFTNEGARQAPRLPSAA